MLNTIQHYDSLFLNAIKVVFAHEGLYSDVKEDRGGRTKFGISERSYPSLDIENLTLDDAREIYFKDYWKKGGYNEIKHQSIAIKLFSLSVNLGSIPAHRLVQRALRSVSSSGPVEDGALGIETMKAINSSEETALLAALKSEAAGYYRSIVSSDPSQIKFLKGWLHRAYS